MAKKKDRSCGIEWSESLQSYVMKVGSKKLLINYVEADGASVKPPKDG